MEIHGILSQWLDVTASQLLSLCLLFATLHGRTGDTAGVPYTTSSVGKPDTTTVCDCPMSSSFLTCQTSAEECEPEEVQDGDSCYRFVTESRKTHEESLLDCIERNSHLVYIESMQEQNFIVSHASSLIRIDYWIGLVAKAMFVWSDGSAKVPDLFPIVGSIGDCVNMVRSSNVLLFFTLPCNQLRNFVCESDTTPTGCPNNWHPFGESCYEIVRGRGQRRSHDAARRYCEDRGGHLVYIETREELDDVRNQLPINVYFWIGLTVTQYHWMDGFPALFQTFESANGDDGNECFRMRPSSLNWNDRRCNNRFGYICERKLSMAPSSEIIDQSGECPSSTPSDLMFLSQSGEMCIDDEDDTIPVLRSCDTWNGIDGCGCGQTNDDLVSCSVGFCKMTFNDTDNKWPSKFNCSCSSDNGNTTFDLIADQGSIGCPIQLPPPTTPMLTTSVSTTTLSTTKQLPTTVEEVTSSMMVAETTEITDIITTISSTTQQSTESFSSPSRQTTSTTTLLTSVDTSTVITDSSTSLSTAEDSTSTSQGEFESTATVMTTTGPTTSQESLTGESGAASGRRGDDSSTGLTVGVTVAAVSVVGAVVGTLVWKKLGGKLALTASKGNLGSSLSPSPQLAGSPNAGVNPMYGLGGDTLEVGGEVLAGVTEGGMYGVRNPTYEGWKGDSDPLEV